MAEPQLDRDQLILAAMSAAGSRSLSPVQVQKLFFILDREVFDDSYFQFQPYNYGPFDAQVYRDLDDLREHGLAAIGSESTYGPRAYRLTDDGLEKGREFQAELSEPLQDYIQGLVNWLLPLSFKEIISYIYERYPEMAENSVFSD